MKRINIPIVFILIFVSFYSMGCVSSNTLPVSYYSFAESDSQAATINFAGNDIAGEENVDFVNFGDAELPNPERGTRWSSTVAFPAGEPLALTVRASYYTDITPMLNVAGAMSDMGNVGIGGIFLMPVVLGVLGLALVVDLPIGIALNFDKRVAFECPPLEAGGNYTLRVRRKSKGVNRALLLTYTDTGTVVYEQAF